MKINTRCHASVTALVRCLALVATILGCLLLSPAGRCDDSTAMAPPVQGDSNADSNAVFNWTDVPQNQQVPLVRATFDQGGYQLYDTVGETIVVPFVNNNLYVMKFARTTGTTMYFVNDGDSPILYVPRHGYLENASVPGAVWHPFTSSFHPTDPCYLGIAPSWKAYIAMGWYPNMSCRGGYYCNSPYGSGIFIATAGFALIIGGVAYNDWHHYHLYKVAHAAPYHIGYFNRSFYSGPHGTFGGFAGHIAQTGGHNAFHGSGGGTNAVHGNGGNNGGHVFGGVGRSPVNNSHVFGGGHSAPSSGSHGGSSGGGHVFGGGGGGGGGRSGGGGDQQHGGR